MRPPLLAEAVTLENCDNEPIHIPSAIQPLGFLLAFGPDQRMLHASANAQTLLGTPPVPGMTLDDTTLPSTLVARLRPWLVQAEPEFEPFLARLAGQSYDVVGHRNDDRVTVVEFERHPLRQGDNLTGLLMRAYRAIEKLRRQKSEDALLAVAVREIRQITGFDRVMAYRFRPDDSGEIVRESRREDLEDWEGRRYPASDIPRQARRLYVRNTLRLIADTHYQPVLVLGPRTPGSPPLDMSSSVLRSVSPIHLEYLQNMGVRASMSISIVVEGRLRGMLACHHHAPYQVAYSVRMACDVMAQVLSSMIASFEERARSAAAVAQSAVINRILRRATASEDLLSAIGEQTPTPAELLPCDAMLVLWGGALSVCRGIAPRGDLMRVIQVLEDARQRIVASSHLAEAYPELRNELLPYCGFLATRFDPVNNGWLIWLRREQIESVVWGGKPEKAYTVGPLGPRLTPRGSFDAWREEVRHTSAPWLPDDIAAVQMLRDELVQIAESRAADLDRARTAMLAMLGHDLRDPLHAISMAATMLARTDTKGARMGERIRSSSSRMQRLISQVLDLSRLQGGLGLGIQPEACDLSQLLEDLAEELRVAHPGLVLHADIATSLALHADLDRMAQVFANLLNNAHRHGRRGMPVSLRAWVAGDTVKVRVSNHADPIPAPLMAHLFSPFKPESLGRSPNRSGLGLGLYIADQIVREHQGDIAVQCTDGLVHFDVVLPASQPASLLSSGASHA